jgi:hypothetical protein
MTILPDFLTEFIETHDEKLREYYSKTFKTEMLERSKRHILVKLASHLDFSEAEQVCINYHHQCGPGKPPTHTVAHLLRAILVGQLKGLSLRELEIELATNFLARWFSGYDLFSHTPDHTTLGRFEGWLLLNHRRIYFDTVLKQIEVLFPKEKDTAQMGDTYAMLANASKHGIVDLLRIFSLRILEVWQSSKHDDNLLCGLDWGGLFGSKPEKHPGRMSKAEKNERLQKTALAAQDLLERMGILSNPSVDLDLWLGYLQKALEDELEIEADKVSYRKKKGDFRFGSATDPEATFRNHGERNGEKDIKFGYNIQIASTENGLITETQAYTGATPDQSGIANLVTEQKEHRNHCPKKMIYDAAAATGKIRHEVEKASVGKTKLSAPLVESYKKEPLFGPYDFTLSQDRKELTCPNGKTTPIRYPSQSGDGGNFRFLTHHCWQDKPPRRMKDADLGKRCPLWKQCRKEKTGPRAMRQVYISDYRPLIEEAKIYNKSDEYRHDHKLRQRIERTVAELVRYNWTRHCRRRGLDAADWQAKMGATTCNLKWWMRRVPA